MAGDVEQKVLEIIARRKGLDPAKLSLDSTFAELGIDSLDGMELLFTFEDSFNISIPDTIAQRMKSVRDVVDGLREVLVNRPAGAG